MLKKLFGNDSSSHFKLVAEYRNWYLFDYANDDTGLLWSHLKNDTRTWTFSKNKYNAQVLLFPILHIYVQFLTHRSLSDFIFVRNCFLFLNGKENGRRWRRLINKSDSCWWLTDFMLSCQLLFKKDTNKKVYIFFVLIFNARQRVFLASSQLYMHNDYTANFKE